MREVCAYCEILGTCEDRKERNLVFMIKCPDFIPKVLGYGKSRTEKLWEDVIDNKRKPL